MGDNRRVFKFVYVFEIVFPMFKFPNLASR